MNYRDNNQGEKLSILGFGCMRFPKKGNSMDMPETEREILHAIEKGVNYFDTAYIYPGSEEALGTILEKNHCRDQVNIATKLPHYLVKTGADFEKYFREELKRLKTDHIDYYLMHMLPDVNVWNHLIEIGVLDFIHEKKEKGQIRHIGFSYHGNTDTFIELLNAYPWEFCQIQYNYLDEHSQAGRRGLQAAAEKHIPVIIMEPLRGGRLVTALPKAARDAFGETAIKRSPAEWAFRWLWNQPEVTVVLSGMNSMEMLEENIRIASKVQAGQQTEQDAHMYQKVIAGINEKTKVPCTGCAYCMPCPFGVDIPGSFRCYNVSYTDNYSNGFREYLMCTLMRNKRSNASLCRECGACEKHCPQSIQIRRELKNVRKRFENPIFKIAGIFIKRIYK
ncbi:MAG: aldo/keto reductase [Lachnospiraceae bacterium]|nr:aldo/keto reductase [Lachnospiraceae bacterium]